MPSNAFRSLKSSHTYNVICQLIAENKWEIHFDQKQSKAFWFVVHCKPVLIAIKFQTAHIIQPRTAVVNTKIDVMISARQRVDVTIIEQMYIETEKSNFSF